MFCVWCLDWCLLFFFFLLAVLCAFRYYFWHENCFKTFHRPILSMVRLVERARGNVKNIATQNYRVTLSLFGWRRRRMGEKNKLLWCFNLKRRGKSVSLCDLVVRYPIRRVFIRHFAILNTLNNQKNPQRTNKQAGKNHYYRQGIQQETFANNSWRPLGNPEKEECT